MATKTLERVDVPTLRNRVTGLRYLHAADLLPNPANWRTHPATQRAALQGLLAEIGIAGALLAYETPAGLQLIDGHLRKDAAPDALWPVLVLDVDEAEAATLLATIDPIAALAGTDAGKLEALLAGVETGSDAVAAMLADLAQRAMLDDAPGIPADGLEAPDRPTLADRFLIPPFSVLDARQGYWQERKRHWLAYGIQSELGRGEGVHNYSEGATLPLDGGTLGVDGSQVYAARNAIPGGSRREAATLGTDGKTVRGDGRGRAVSTGLLGESQQSEDYRQGNGSYAKGSGLARCFGQDLMRGEHVVGRYQSDGYESSTGNDGKAFRIHRGKPSRAETASLTDGLTWGTSIHPYDTTGQKRNSRVAADQRSNLSGAPTQASGAHQTGTENMAPGTSIFDPVLCEVAYRWFSPPDGRVLDPFAGGSVRGIVAALLGRKYTGIDLSAAQIAANEQQAETITPDARPTWHVGDSRDVAGIAPGTYDMIFSCPPYADLERYSDDPRDLSTLSYVAFLEGYRAIIAASCTMLAPDRFACFVVGDVRDPKGLYRNFVSDTIAAFHAVGLALYNEAILVTAVGSLPIRVGKQFTSGRKLGKTHQNVVIFVKGDPRRATAACGPVDVPDLAEDGADG